MSEARPPDRRSSQAVRTVLSPPRTLPRPAPKGRFTRKLVIALCLLLLVTAGIRFAPLLAGSDTVPATLVGSWETSDPHYTGRYLELTRDSVIVRASANEATGYGVQSVQRRQIAAKWSTYVITAYSETGGQYTLTLEYREAQQTITLANPANVLWRRAR
jgi:hypothetical protein